MSVQLDAALAQAGTRFRIFPQPRFLPAFAVPEVVYTSVPPGPDGRFDHLDPDSREFSRATMYATVRRVLDVRDRKKAARPRGGKKSGA